MREPLRPSRKYTCTLQTTLGQLSSKEYMTHQLIKRTFGLLDLFVFKRALLSCRNPSLFVGVDIEMYCSISLLPRLLGRSQVQVADDFSQLFDSLLLLLDVVRVLL